MSRLEKNFERRYKMQKKRFMLKVIFIISMTILTSICLIIVYDNANTMLCNNTFKEDRKLYLENIETYIKNKISNFR